MTAQAGTVARAVASAAVSGLHLPSAGEIWLISVSQRTYSVSVSSFKISQMDFSGCVCGAWQGHLRKLEGKGIINPSK